LAFFVFLAFFACFAGLFATFFVFGGAEAALRV